ncbi:MAG: Lrp/AsnC family transcriptional regulator [Candidatus Thorarchaeota archaeon]
MDALDKKILLELIRNGRISYRNLGARINLSASSVKKRLDNFEASGFIDRFVVMLNPDLVNLRLATLMVFTDASVKIDVFRDVVMQVEGVYMILPFIDGNYYVSCDYVEESDLVALSQLIGSIPGVEGVEVHDVLLESRSHLPEMPEFTENELRVIGQLAVNPRMIDYDIATNLGWSTKKVKQVLQKLEGDRKIAVGFRWNPNLGKDTAFTMTIKYDKDITTANDITSWLDSEYPVSYFNSRVVESQSTIFGVFTVEKVVDMEPIAMAVLNLPGVQRCFAMTYYNAIVGKTLSQIRLERLLEQEGLWHHKD